MKCIIYCRKSSEEESKQTQSLETQETILTEYASKNGLEVVEIIKESRSATNDGHRPKFDYMLQKIRDGEANAILIVRPDRLSRNYIEFGYVVKLLEEDKLQCVITPSQTYTKSEDQIMYMSIHMLTATNEPRRLSTRVKEGMKTKLAKGEYPCHAPIGYINKDKNITPCPTNAKYIKKAFELYATGLYSLKGVTNVLYDEGFRTRKAKLKVCKADIHRMLKNPVYYGMIRRYGQLFEGRYEPIITEELFNIVQDVFNGKTRPKKQKHEFLYRDLLTCDVCGCKITADKKIKKNGKVYNYYYCTNGKRKCDQHKKYINETNIEKLISQQLSKFTLDKEKAKLSLDAYYLSEKKKHQDKSEVKNELEKQKIEIESDKKTLVQKNVKGIIDDESTQIQIADYKKELEEIEKSLKSLNKDLDTKTFELCYKWLEPLTTLDFIFLDGNDPVKSNLSKSVLSNCTVKNSEIITVEYNKPFVYFKNLNETDDLDKWRRVRDSNPRTLADHPFSRRARSTTPSTLQKSWKL